MATKKQKRLEGERKALQQREESRLSGLRAQQRDRERRLKKQQEQEAEDKRAKAKKAVNGMVESKAS